MTIVPVECKGETGIPRTSETSAPILLYADFTFPFMLQTDESLKGLGAVLTQVKTIRNE